MSSTVDDEANALLIQVENYNNANNSSDQLGTYLRLGAVPDGLVTAYDAVNGGGSDSGAFTTANGEDLASKVLTFVDDTRDRGTGDFLTLSTTERQAETKLLHTKGGWRDHTDGNRVTTTRGDKVEGIGGNYKLMVLGREQWTQDGNGNDLGVGLHHESSGGITYHYDEVPGQIIDVRRKGDGTTWTVMEECSTGHFVARYHGVDKEWHQGGDLKLRVGSKGAYRVHKGASWNDVKDDDGFQADADFDKPTDAAHNASFDWPGDSTLPSVTEHTFANKVKSKLFCKKVEEIDGDNDFRIERLEEWTWANKIEEMNTFVYYEQRMKGALCRESWKGFFFECFIGLSALTLKVGFFWDFRVGFLTLDLNLALSFLQVNACVRRTQVDLSLLRLNLSYAATVNEEHRYAALFTDYANQKFELNGVKKETGVKYVT